MAEGRKLVADLQDLLDASPDAVLVVDRAGIVVALNRRTEALFATTAGQLRGHPVEVLLPARLRQGHAVARAAYSRAPTVRQMSARPGLTGLRADGSEFPVEISLTPIVGSDAGLVMAVVREAGTRAGLAEALEESGRSAGTLDAIADAILTTDARGRVDFLNSAAQRLTGRTREWAGGRLLSEVFSLAGDTAGELLDVVLDECLRNGVAGRPCEIVLPAGAGQESCALDISATPIRDRSGSLTGAAVVARDVTHAKLIARQLSHQATHDALTGLVNRSEFERRLARALVSAGEERAEHAVCFLDLDGFKRVNDIGGHLAGDELLRQLSDLMRERMRSRDTLARLGGDEFGMILEHCRLPKAARIAEEIRAAICAHRFVFEGETYAVGASVGIAPVRPNGVYPSDILRAADSACYLAKRRGGNRIELYDRRRWAGKASRNRDLVRRILSAIEEDRLQLHAQLLVPLDGADGRAPRLELLLRLGEDGGEPLLPGAFLPAAKRNGLMPRIDRWVIGRASRRLVEWQRSRPGFETPTVSVNLGEETVVGGDLGAVVREALEGSGLRPGALCFEIGESVAAAHVAASARLVHELREAGCQVTLEHCGSGLAAFTLLRRMPVDYLKIAGHIVRSIASDPVNRALATALNDAGHALGMGTMGIEVESPSMLAALRGVGVDYAQGYGIRRPESLDAALEGLGASPAGAV